MEKHIGKLIVAGVVAVLFFVTLGTALGYRTDCVRAEAEIKAQYTQNQNNYSNMFAKFRELAQVPAMYADDLLKVYKPLIEGRYQDAGLGAPPAQALIKFVQEHNPSFDASLYRGIQTAIEAGRNSFAADQQSLIDRKRAYEVVLQGNRAVLVGWAFGFPKIDLDQYGIVTNAETEEAFKTKKAAPIQLR